jgi:membrane-associated protein
MELVSYFVDLLAHFDQHLRHWLQAHGMWAIAILALIVFAETGLVFFPFLPGDSMLFIVGVFCGAGLMDLHLVAPALIAAAITLMHRLPMVRRGHEYTHRWFERHGPRTIVIARFVPVLRTYAPFAAGFGRMDWALFTRWNVLGAILWVGSLTALGWLFGDLPLIRDNLSKAILVIVVVSLLPLVVSGVSRRAAGKGAQPLKAP